MADPTLSDRLPSVFPPEDGDSDFSKWLAAHQDEIDRFKSNLDAAKKSLQVAHATGQELDQIGKDFGILGRRRGRDDTAYRQYLQSLVPAYTGRGTAPGLKTAVAAGVVTDASNIGIVEDESANRYEVQLHDWSAHKTGTVHTLANVADPSVVQRRDPLHYFLGSTGIHHDVSTTAGEESFSVSAPITHGVASGSRTISTQGLSASELEPLSTGGGWNLSETN